MSRELFTFVMLSYLSLTSQQLICGKKGVLRGKVWVERMSKAMDASKYFKHTHCNDRTLISKLHDKLQVCPIDSQHDIILQTDIFDLFSQTVTGLS